MKHSQFVNFLRSPVILSTQKLSLRDYEIIRDRSKAKNLLYILSSLILIGFYGLLLKTSLSF